MNILWCGTYNNELAVRECPGVSMSGVKWATGFLSALAKKAQLHALTHTIERVWPKGRLLIGRNRAEHYLSLGKRTSFSYLALPFVSEWILRWKYTSAAKKILETEKVDVVLLYNCLQSYHVDVMHVAKEHGVPCIPIILDGDDPRRDNWKKILQDTQNASGVVALSRWMVENFPRKLPLLHLDGGSNAWHGGDNYKPTQNKRLKIVYTGALARWIGLDFIIAIIKAVKRQDVDFYFCGKVAPEEANRLAGQDPRIKMLGFISEQELNTLCREADVFLNIRNPQLGENLVNYPSKLPQYLSYGKPVVSTIMHSLSEDYKSIMYFAPMDNVEGFVSELNKVLDMNDADKKTLFDRMHTWFLQNKTWDVQAGRLVEWMKGEVLNVR